MNFKKILTTVFCVGLVCLELTACDKNTVSDEIKNVINDNQTQNTSYPKGEIVESEYINKSLGLKFVLPKEYRFSINDEIALLEKMIENNYLTDKAKKIPTTTTIEVFAFNINSSNNNFNFMIEDLNFNIDEETYAEISKKNAKSMIVNGNITYYQDSKEYLGGIEFYVMSNELILDNEKFRQKQFLKSLDKKMVLITFTYETEDELKKMINAFQKIE